MAADWRENARQYWRPLVDARFSGPSDPARLDMMDGELDVLLREMRVRALRLRNNSTRACSLPTEILTNIFSDLRDMWAPERLDSFLSGWMVVTHVCSKWREVAVGAPGLWAKHSEFLGTSLRYLPTILARSKNHPLDLTALWPEPPERNDLVGWLSPPICSRVKHLHLEGFADDDCEQLLPEISPYLSKLQTLYLETDCPYDRDVELPHELCNIVAITDLTLKGFSLPWTSPIFSTSITTLTIHMSGNPITQPTSACFEDFCSSMPLLQSLRLDNVVPLDHSDDIIYMPRTLRYFNLRTYTSSNVLRSLSILPQLRFPDPCMRSASIHDDEHRVDEHLLDTCEPLKRCLERFHLFGNEAEDGPMELYYNYGQILAMQREQTSRFLDSALLQTWTLPHDSVGSATGAHTLLRVDCTSFDDGISSLRLNDLRAITIAPDSRTDLASLMPRFASHASRVHRVGLWLSRSAAVLHALMKVERGKFAIFPCLKILVLRGIQYVEYANEATLFAQLTALVALVELRRSAGSPLMEIFVSRSTESWGVWDALRRDVTISFYEC
ncbi:unnamed protein product [Peniophora sp. CBMAI 1063]|nr:unnamed protein product [Peniophora sp. CBMAI 1063]